MSVSREIIKSAVELNRTNAYNVVTSDPPFPLVAWGSGLRTRADDLIISNVFTNNVSVDPQSASTSVLASGGNVDFWIREGQYDIIDAYTLKLIVDNGTGATVSFPSVPQLINFVEISCNNGADLLSQFDGDYLYCLTSCFNSTEWGAKAGMMNTTAQWGNVSAGIASGASKTFYLLMKDTILNQVKLNMRYISGDIRIRFNFRPWSTTAVLGATAPSLSCSLILNQINLDVKDQLAKQAIYRNVGNGIPDPIILRYLDATRFYSASMTLSPNTKYSLPLSSVRGMVSHVYFFVRPAGSTGFGLCDFKAIGKFDIVDNNNNSIIQYPQESDFNLFMEYNQFFPTSSLTQYKNLYTYSFNLSPLDSYNLGYQTGFYPFTSYEKLVIDTGTLTAGNYDVTAYFITYKNVVMSDGRLEPLSSN